MLDLIGRTPGHQASSLHNTFQADVVLRASSEITLPAVNKRESSYANTVYLLAYGFNWKNISDIPETTCNILCHSSIISVSGTSSVYICMQPDLSPILACRSCVYPERSSASSKISSVRHSGHGQSTKPVTARSVWTLGGEGGRRCPQIESPRTETLNPSVCLAATSMAIA